MRAGRQKNELELRLTRVLGRLVEHLELLAGAARDTWKIRNDLRERPKGASTHGILDDMENFLVEADRELHSLRDTELRILAYSHSQCESLIDQSGHMVTALAHIRAAHDDNHGALPALQEVTHDMNRLQDRLKLLERKLNELQSGTRNRVDLVFKDELTGAYAAEGFAARLAELHARWHRAGSPLALVAMHIDVKDEARVSPLARDDLMRRCAREIEDRVRVSDVLARTGPSEFVLLLPDTSVDGANAFTSRMLIALEAVAFEKVDPPLSAVVWAGVTTAQEGDEVDTLLERGRQALADALGRPTGGQVVR